MFDTRVEIRFFFVSDSLILMPQYLHLIGRNILILGLCLQGMPHAPPRKSLLWVFICRNSVMQRTADELALRIMHENAVVKHSHPAAQQKCHDSIELAPTRSFVPQQIQQSLCVLAFALRPDEHAYRHIHVELARKVAVIIALHAVRNAPQPAI